MHFPACLIFCSVFLLCLIVFFAKLIKFYMLHFCRFCLVLLPRFGQLAFTLDLFFLMLHTFLHINFVWINLFYLFVEFLMLCLARFVLPCICLKISRVHQFAITRFRFFWRCWLFFYIPLAYTHSLCTVNIFLPPPIPPNDRL